VPPVLDLHVETFTRDGVDILCDIRWQVMPGQHWVVLGANGAGKSSLFEWLPSRQSARQVAATGIHATIGSWHTLSALGPLNEVLTDTHLSNLYSYPCKVTASNDRYTLK